jgi:regulatory protein
VLDALSRRRLQSDERFAEQYLYSRQRRGYGPLRIRAELRERGVDEGLIEAYLDERDEGWLACLRQAHDKKYGDTLPQNFKEQARRARFLQYRGFTAEQIRGFFRDDGSF